MKAHDTHKTHSAVIDEAVTRIQVVDPRHKYSPDTTEISFAYGRSAKEHEVIDYTYRKVRIEEAQKVYLENRGIVFLNNNIEFIKGDPENTSLALTHASLGVIHYRKTIPLSAFKKISNTVFSWDIDYDWGTTIPAQPIKSSNVYEYTLRLSFFAREKEGEVKRHFITVSSLDTKVSCAHYKKISSLKMLWGCLAQGTLITMADESLKPIEEVSSGDLVMSMYGLPLRVINTYVGEESELYVVRTEAEHEIMATLTHPFLTEKGMLPLILMKHMEKVELGDGQLVRITQCFPVPYAEKVYNLDTENGQAFIGNGFVVGDFTGQNSNFSLEGEVL